MMSFLALNMQVAEASVAMHEMPIATAAKEVPIRQATAFPFLEDVCIGRTRLSCSEVVSWRAGVCYPFASEAREVIIAVHVVQVSCCRSGDLPAKWNHAQHHCRVRHSGFADWHGRCRAMPTGRARGQPHTRSRPD